MSAEENRSPFQSLELEGQWHFSPASGIKGPKNSSKVLRTKTERERGIRKLPVRGVYREVISIGGLHKASQPIQIRRAKEDGSAPGMCEANSATPSFVLPNES